MHAYIYRKKRKAETTPRADPHQKTIERTPTPQFDLARISDILSEIGQTNTLSDAVTVSEENARMQKGANDAVMGLI